jgi:hypothetical protein
VVCPECGGAVQDWRTALTQAWLLVPALRLLQWGLPLTLASVCLARLIAELRNSGAAPLFWPQSLLVYALPLVLSLTGALLLGVASPARLKWRRWLICGAAASLAGLCIAAADYQHFHDLWFGVSQTGKINTGFDWSAGFIAGNLAAILIALVGVLVVAVLAQLAGIVGVGWLSRRRSMLCIGVLIAVALGALAAPLADFLWVLRAHDWTVSGKVGNMPRGIAYQIQGPALGLSAMVILFIWTCTLVVLARLRPDPRVCAAS